MLVYVQQLKIKPLANVFYPFTDSTCSQSFSIFQNDLVCAGFVTFGVLQRAYLLFPKGVHSSCLQTIKGCIL